MEFKKLLEIYLKELQFLYNPDEIRAIFYRLTDFYYHISRLDLSLHPEKLMPNNHLIDALQELKTGKPWQYITGETTFYGLKFKVDKFTLIPRPETEELVDWIINDYKKIKDINILDIGTGSGAIAVSLSKNLPNTQVTALDLSKETLFMANQNATMNHVRVHFIQINILETGSCSKKYDVIVSNPPYVRLSEKEMMHPNVLKFEPEVALFVPDEQALVFYKKILQIALNNQTKTVYFEINEFLKSDLEELLKDLDLTNYTFKKDFSGKWRMLKVML